MLGIRQVLHIYIPHAAAVSSKRRYRIIVYTEGVLVATHVPEVPTRDSPTKYGRTEDGREGERARDRTGQDRMTRMRKRGLGQTRRQVRVSSGDVCTGAG